MGLEGVGVGVACWRDGESDICFVCMDTDDGISLSAQTSEEKPTQAIRRHGVQRKLKLNNWCFS